MKVEILGMEPPRISVEGQNGLLVLNMEQLASILSKDFVLGHLDRED